jgi:flagellar hook-associated protein 1 FlgK
MSSLFGTMWMAVGAMLTEQAALDVTANNVANLNTPGFSRRRPVIVSGDVLTAGPADFQSGVKLGKVESLRDPILELRIQEEYQQQGQLDAFVSGMSQLQVMFTSSDGDIGTRISDLFSSLGQLSTDPTNLALRQSVLTSAGNLANAFRTTSQNLISQRSNLDLSVGQSVKQINQLTGQIADLNSQITSLENVGNDASSFVDQRNVAIGQLSALIDVAVVKTENSVTLTTANGTPLVAGNKSFNLDTQLDPSGVQHIFSLGTDITGDLVSGSLAGQLQVRDQKIPGLLANLDALASALATSLNAANGKGFDLNGKAGGDIFLAPPASGVGAAVGMTVSMTDSSLLAASSDGSPGSNGNVANLTAVHDQKIVSGQTPTDYYAGIVFNVGNDVMNGTAESDASQLILRQLQDQRGSVSGVSLDEEASNMIAYQRAYEAAARMVSTVNDILDTTINLGRY